MIYQIVVSPRAQKALKQVPESIQDKLETWMQTVRKIPGYHDEPLKGLRKGQRSIKLNRSYRAIYTINQGIAKFASIEEVNKHEY